ncbi:MAG: hypothetical protein U9R23_05715 [Candidatus Cloacimonadota bacterium]|nr:hypothetical protein [Candidatus Cloacimonadota bacterium]
MNTVNYNLNLSLNFQQVLELIKQLPFKEKKELSKELEKEMIDKKLSALLNTFRTDELSYETITNEVEKVRESPN